MKRLLCVSVAIIIAVGVFLTGCTPAYSKSPDQYEKIRWIAPDYSFMINPKEDSKGFYKFNGKKYNIQAKFESSRLSVVDTDNKDTELFFGNWMYDEEEHLYIYNLSFRTDNYKELDGDLAEYITLNQEALK